MFPSLKVTQDRTDLFLSEWFLDDLRHPGFWYVRTGIVVEQVFTDAPLEEGTYAGAGRFLDYRREVEILSEEELEPSDVVRGDSRDTLDPLSSQEPDELL